LVVASGIYWGFSIQNFVQIRSDSAFLLYNVYGFTFLLDTLYIDFDHQC